MRAKSCSAAARITSDEGGVAVSEVVRLGVRPAGSFKPAGVFGREKSSAQAAFAARHFAVKRAGFLLRELARQYEEPAGDELPELATITHAAADDSAGGAGGQASAEPAVAVATGPTPEEIQRLVTEAEERGRAQAKAELAAALDQAIVALDAAGRTLVQMQGEVERRLIVPLAQASLHIGSELARQALLEGDGLARYLDAVADSIKPAGEHDTDAAIAVHMNPDDLAVLERASRRPEFLRLVPDALVPSGGVTASSGDKVIDDRFENRVREIRERVLGLAADLRREVPP
jgi:vacuolar-type H+-ATPase subunit E/Vma4